MRLFNKFVAGFAKGLYDLFEDSALAIADTMGSEILGQMETELGIQVVGENPGEIFTQLKQLLVDEYGMIQDAKIAATDNQIGIEVTECLMWQATEELIEADVPPYICMPMMMTSASLHKRLDTKLRFDEIVQDTSQHICNIKFCTK